MRSGREMKHLLEVEKGQEAVDGRPSVGPVYRSAFAKDGFPPPVPGIDSCWDIFRCDILDIRFIYRFISPKRFFLPLFAIKKIYFAHK